ncbi:MAG: RHS repeat-associated core domain-containing protein [Gammaproteobacteria bacterium]
MVWRRALAQLDGPLDVETPTYLHTDHLATPRLGTDQAGIPVWRWENPAFGDAPPSLQLRTVNLRFPGQYFDHETGLYYNYFRTYDPATGRYITSDPIGLRGGLNTYLYAEANPLKFTDPTGEAAIALPWVVPPLIEGLKWCAATLTFIAITAICGDEDGCFGGDDDDPSCEEHFTRCLDSSLADLPGSVYGSSRCGVCRDQCVRNGGTWPDIAITGSGSVRCDYWRFQ